MLHTTQFSSSPAPNPIISDAVEIHLILKQVLIRHSMLKITVPGYTNKFSSAMLTIEHEKKYFVIDELFPKVNSELLRHTDTEFFIQSMFNGIGLFFRTRLVEVHQQGDEQFYIMNIPGNHSAQKTQKSA